MPTGIQAFLVPRQDMTPKELKQLWQHLSTWGDDLDEKNVPYFLDPLPLSDLEAGELPQPLALRETIGPLRISKELVELIQEKGGDPANLTPEELEELGVEWEPPKPGALKEQREKLGKAADLRGIRLGYDDFSPGGRERFCDTIRNHIPAGLIEDILSLPDCESWLA